MTTTSSTALPTLPDKTVHRRDFETPMEYQAYPYIIKEVSDIYIIEKMNKTGADQVYKVSCRLCYHNGFDIATYKDAIVFAIEHYTEKHKFVGGKRYVDPVEHVKSD